MPLEKGRDIVTTNLSYFDFLPCHQTAKPYEILINLPEAAQAVPRTNFAFKSYECQIEDARGAEKDFTLNENGFAWRKYPSTVLDLRNRDEIEQNYLPETEIFIRQNLEGNIKKVHFFDWRRRLSMEQGEFSKRTIDLNDGLDPLLPAAHPHIDQSPVGAVRRCNFHLPDEAEDLMKGRFRIINVWRPLAKVQSWPLAVCSAPSVDPADLVANDIVRRRYVGEALFAKHNSKHEWWYLDGQSPDEVAILKIFDSDEKIHARFCLHTSFMASNSDVHFARESLEVRAMVFDYPNDE